jgi:DNA-binding PadR family transcriptional regulator
MEAQFNLQGEELEEQQHNKSIRYSNICIEFGIYWERRDRIWNTLKFFYYAKALSKQIIWRRYNPIISENSITNHLKRLQKEDLIRLIAQNVGTKRSEKYYEITSKGVKVYDKLLDEL